MKLQDQRLGIEELAIALPHLAEVLSRPLADSPMQTFYIPITTHFFSELVTFVFSFQVPGAFDAAYLQKELRTIVHDRILRYVRDLNKLTSQDNFNPGEAFDKEYSDALEYLLSPCVGQAVYDSRVPIFRYHVQLRREVDHNLEVAGVIPTDEDGYFR